ncbi:glycosyl hydrolase family 8 [Methylorubrum extorquens]|uniref:cellulase n=1 Tax=Methylorubrum extorquens (strain CM4 / NCIMB 13688) TaxID=440085 RepID=B7KRP7_METC4|nr:glycosyl hydrolase family 8 [Methylorubrum extorquens]ACK85574.1 Cellulase [Methylorubrum extorquens CM4]GEL44372.1 endoglucanase [Methylorubrum extorquens]
MMFGRPRAIAASLLLGLTLAPLQAMAEPAPIEAKPAAGATVGKAASVTAETLPMLNSLGQAGAWRSYKARFVTDQGRVVDTANGRISHSESQGYGLLLAVAAGDRDTFQRIWNWTRANLMVRDDALLAWRWEPDKRPAVADMNDATDGDILVAWALVEAGEGWADDSYRLAARRIAVDIARRTVLFRTEGPPLLLPAMSGFSAEDRPDGPVINLSYWIFPAFPRLAAVAPEFDWDRLGATGRDLVLRARFGDAKLPTEWISMRGGQPQPASGFPPHFSYNALRVPLYLAMAGISERRYYEPLLALWGEPDPAGLPIIDTEGGSVAGRMAEPGYAIIPALAACAVTGAPLPAGLQDPATDENYYPATLHLLALTAANMRYRPCLGR